MTHKSYKAVVSDILTRQNSEKRFVVIDVQSREVLSDNEGQGFSTESKAITSYELKTFGKTTKDIKKSKDQDRVAGLKQKLESHKPTVDELEDLFNDE